MAFRATKDTEYNRAKSTATELKRVMQIRKNEMAAGNVSASVIRELLDRLVRADAVLAEVAAVPGMANYAKAQEGDPLYDVASEFQAMRSAIQNARGWILSNIPTNGGYVLLEQWTASGVNVRTFAPAATAGLRTILDTVISAVD